MFSGTNWLAMNVAPCGSLITASLAPRGVERAGDDLAAELARLRRRGVGVVDAERDAPVRRRVGVVGGDRVERGDDVDEPLGRAHLRHLLAEARAALLEVVAVAGQRPHHPGGQGQRLPPEHGAVERLRRFDVPGGEAVEVQRAVLVDDLRTLVLLRLPDAERRAFGIGEHRHPPRVHDVERLGQHRAAGVAAPSPPSRRRSSTQT